MRGLFLRLTGCAVSVNGLRSAFLTWAYNRRDCDDQMKDSLARALRHSRREAEQTYDRRTAADRLHLAVGLARGRAEDAAYAPLAEEDGPGDEEPGEDAVKPGQFVALVEQSSTPQKPKILLGRVQALLPQRMVSLLWFKPDRAGTYSLHLDGTLWKESLDALVAVDVQVAKNKPHSCRLKTAPRSIHKKVHGATDLI